MTNSYRPARAGLSIPMPDRGGRLMQAAGEVVDLGIPYYRRLAEDGDIVAVETETRRAPRRKKER